MHETTIGNACTSLLGIITLVCWGVFVLVVCFSSPDLLWYESLIKFSGLIPLLIMGTIATCILWESVSVDSMEFIP